MRLTARFVSGIVQARAEPSTRRSRQRPEWPK